MDDHEEKLKKIINAISDQKTPLSSLLPPKMSQESVVPIINSIANDEKGVYQVNIPNRGAISGIPDDVVVEVPAEVDAKGPHRIQVKFLPKRVMNYSIYPRMMRMEWALEAFLEGGRDPLFEWLINDVRTKSVKQVNETIGDLLSLQENKEMAEHFS